MTEYLVRTSGAVRLQSSLVWLREISCKFVDRVLRIWRYTIHGVTLN